MAADGEGQDPGQRAQYGLKSVRGNVESVSAFRIKIWVKHGDRTSYIIWGTWNKMKIQGSLFKKQEKMCHERY